MQALAAKDAGALLEVLDPAVDFRAMTPSKFWEADSSAEAVDAVFLGTWFAPSERIEAIERLDHDSINGRYRVGYRFLVTNPDGAFAVDQQAYFDVRDGRIPWLRIMCAGYRRVTA